MAASASTTPAPSARPATEAGPKLSEATSFALDVLRCVTAEAVVVGHALSFFQVLPELQPPRAPAMQEVGVVIFFVLSGFLIAHTTWVRKRRSRESAYGFREFFIDRFARIYSGYVPALLFIAAADFAVLKIAPGAYAHREAFDGKTALGNVFMLENFPALDILHRRVALVPSFDRFGSGRPLWTLSIEWWIYMFFGWAVLAERGRARYWLVFAGLAIVPFWNAIGGLGEGIALAWAYGAVACALLWRKAGDAFSTRVWALAATLCAVLACLRGALTNGRAYDGALVALIAFTLTTSIFALQRSTLAPVGPIRRVVRFVADYSFTLYLVHYTVLEALTLARGRMSDPLLVSCGILASNVIAMLLALPGELRHRSFSRYLHRRFG